MDGLADRNEFGLNLDAETNDQNLASNSAQNRDADIYEKYKRQIISNTNEIQKLKKERSKNDDVASELLLDEMDKVYLQHTKHNSLKFLVHCLNNPNFSENYKNAGRYDEKFKSLALPEMQKFIAIKKRMSKNQKGAIKLLRDSPVFQGNVENDTWIVFTLDSRYNYAAELVNKGESGKGNHIQGYLISNANYTNDDNLWSLYCSTANGIEWRLVNGKAKEVGNNLEYRAFIFKNSK